MPKATPKLDELAEACWNGACNVSGLLISLGEAAREAEPFTLKTHPALPIILGQIAHLVGSGREEGHFDWCGPDPAAIRAWEAYKALPKAVELPSAKLEIASDRACEYKAASDYEHHT